VLRQRIAGRKRYPLVLMLEPLFRCNLSCFGCGKIDYPDAILNKRLSVQECLDAVDECGAPMVAIPGGEPLIHREIGEIVKGIVARKKFVSLCTNALLLEKKLHLFEPSPYLFFSVHLDGIKEHHDKSVCLEGGYEKAIDAIRAAKAKGFTVNVNCTIFDGHPAEDIAKFLDLTTELGVGVSISPGYAYERAPDQQHFLNRRKTKELFRKVFALGKGNAETFTELMEATDWDVYGTGRYEKCANCMAHCGYEATAAEAMMQHPLEAFGIALRGVRTEGPMAREIDLSKQRPAQYVFDSQVQLRLSEIRANEALEKAAKEAAKGATKNAARTSASAA